MMYVIRRRNRKFTGWGVLMTLLFFLISPVMRGSGEGYTVKFQIHGLLDTTCLIANYYGNGTYVIDTLEVDNKGRCIFTTPANQPRGVYIFVISDNNYFDFVLNNDLKFSMETSKSNPVKDMKVTGSVDNEEFYAYMAYNQELFSRIQQLQQQLHGVEPESELADSLTKSITRMNDDIISYKLQIVESRPFSFLAMLINAMKEPVIKEIPVLPNGRKDSTYAYRYYKQHYWDDMDLTDDRLIRTPVFHNKLKKYMDQVVVQHPDSIFREAVWLIEQSRPDPEMFKYLVWFMTYHYENSEIMGFDAVFVDIVDKYYVSGDAIWVNNQTLESIIKKANRIRPLRLGLTAPNMIMMDTANTLVSLYNIKSFITIILFWDPDCGHCEKEIPQLKKLYDTYKESWELEIFGVCSDTSMAKMKSYMKKNHMNWINVNGPRTLTGDYHELYDIQTTPVIFIIDRDKKILAKRLPTDQIEPFLKNYIRRETGKDPI